MIIKRIRQTAKRKRRPLAQVRAIIEALTAYSIDADLERLLELGTGRSPQATYALDLKDLDELAEPGEKVDAHGTRNLIGTKLLEFQKQMIAACLLAPRAKDPIEHYVVSWRAGEIPNDEQIEEVVDVFAAEMGLGNCQILWATHANTAQRHLHLVVNRVDLVTKKIIAPGDGWDIDRLHQVSALIEDRQGWLSEPNAIYSAKRGVVTEKAAGQIVRRADGSRDGCHKRKRVAPERGGSEGYEAVAIALRSATSWRDLHYRLAGEGAAYAPKGSGAEISIHAERMRASEFGREFSFKRMVDRLGPFEPDVHKSQDPHALYKLALREERTRLREALNSVLELLRERRRSALRRLKQLKRDEYLLGMEEERMELAFARVEAAIRREYDLARRSIAASYLNRQRWYEAGQPDPQTVALPDVIFAGDDPRDLTIVEERGFHTYRHQAGADYHDKAGARAVSDLGVLLLVHQRNLAAVELALELASTRGNSITVSGSEAFLDLCRSVTERRAFNVVLEDGTSLAPRSAISESAQQDRARQACGATEACRNREPDLALNSASNAPAEDPSSHAIGDRSFDPETQTRPAVDHNENQGDELVAIAAAARARRAWGR